MCKTNKLSVYLVKEGLEIVDIVKNTSHSKALNGIGTFFFEDSRNNTPSWVTDFFLGTLDDINFYNSSSKGLLITSIEVRNRIVKFAIPFGTGRYMLKEGVIEEQFGLKVTLNSIDPKSIKSIEKNNIGGLSKISREQMSRECQAMEFGIDIEQDLVRALTGKVRSSTIFGSTISGSDSLSLSTKVNISNLNSFLSSCYEAYQSTSYQSDFAWIDQIKDIKNPAKVTDLNSSLISKLNNRELDRIWMAVPDILEWSDVKWFKYLKGQHDYQDDLCLTKFLESYDEQIDDIKFLKDRSVKAFSAQRDDVLNSWPVFKCLVGEIEINGKLYVLNYGKWYEVNSDYVQTVNQSYSAIEISDLNLPDYSHTDEGEYNKNVRINGLEVYCLDRKNIHYGGGHSSIEFCDLITRNRHIIHVKHNRGSGALSHLFMQGAVSGELFMNDSQFRSQLNNYLPDCLKLNGERPIAQDYEVIYAIISSCTSERPQIPFFSKISIKNAKRRLEGYGFKFKLKKIYSQR